MNDTRLSASVAFFSAETSADDVAGDALTKLRADLGGDPHLLLVYAAGAVDVAPVLRSLRRRTDAKIAGGTSARGLLGSRAIDGPIVGLFAIRDVDGAFGVGTESLATGGARLAGATAARRSAADAGRPGELPALVWICSAPGDEEHVLVGVGEVYGPHAPIVGGSSADDFVQGHWRQLARDQVFDDHVVVVTMHTTARVETALQCGYEPTEKSWLATRAEGRSLLALDGEPAFESWRRAAAVDEADSTSLLAASTFHPLGRPYTSSEGTRHFILVHPAAQVAGGGMSLFARAEEGQELVLMRGTPDSLVGRAARVAEEVKEMTQVTPDRIRGALVVFCAGCRFAIEDRMEEVAASLARVLPGVPLLGVFTFGEQGCPSPGGAQHANLMVSVTLFADSDPQWRSA